MQPEKLLAAAHCNIPAHEPRFSEVIKLRAICAKRLIIYGSDPIHSISTERLENLMKAYNNELKDIVGL